MKRLVTCAIVIKYPIVIFSLLTGLFFATYQVHPLTIFSAALTCFFIVIYRIYVVNKVKANEAALRNMLKNIFLDTARDAEYDILRYHKKDTAEIIKEIESSISKAYSMSIRKKQAELTALQSQINPHFLYNTLDAIRGQALMFDAEEIADMTEALSSFFRYSISNKGNTVSIQDELENICNYIKIQHFRFGDRINLDFSELPPELMDCKLPKMTLQPIVENAVYHGLESCSKKGVIKISAERLGNRVEIKVSDNGKGIDYYSLCNINERLNSGIDYEEAAEGENYRSTGVALNNVNQRIKLYFGNDCGIRVYSTPEVGTDVVINLTYQSDESIL